MRIKNHVKITDIINIIITAELTTEETSLVGVVGVLKIKDFKSMN